MINAADQSISKMKQAQWENMPLNIWWNIDMAKARKDRQKWKRSKTVSDRYANNKDNALAKKMS